MLELWIILNEYKSGACRKRNMGGIDLWYDEPNYPNLMIWSQKIQINLKITKKIQLQIEIYFIEEKWGFERENQRVASQMR